MSQSIVTSVREQLAAIPVGTFVSARTLVGPTDGVGRALARIVAERDSLILRARPCLYWRTEWTRFGPYGPRAEHIAYEITPPGTGPAFVHAAHSLALTTQVPSIQHYAVPGRTPRPFRGIKFLRRPIHRRDLGLRLIEVALLEAFRTPFLIEEEWPEVVRRVGGVIDGGFIRLDLVRQVADMERFVQVRRMLDGLAADLG